MHADFPLPVSMAEANQSQAIRATANASGTVTKLIDMAARVVDGHLAGAAAVAVTLKETNDVATAFGRLAQDLDLWRYHLRMGWERYALAVACQTTDPMAWCAIIDEMGVSPVERRHATFEVAYSALRAKMSFADAYLAVDVVDMLMDRAEEEGRRIVDIARTIDTLCGRDDEMPPRRGTDIAWVEMHMEGEYAFSRARDAIVDHLGDSWCDIDARRDDPPELRSEATAVLVMHRLDGMIAAARHNGLHCHALDLINDFREKIGLGGVDAVLAAAAGPLVHAGLPPQARRRRTTALSGLEPHKPIDLPEGDGLIVQTIETSNRIGELVMSMAKSRREGRIG